MSDSSNPSDTLSAVPEQHETMLPIPFVTEKAFLDKIAELEGRLSSLEQSAHLTAKADGQSPAEESQDQDTPRSETEALKPSNDDPFHDDEVASLVEFRVQRYPHGQSPIWETTTGLVNEDLPDQKRFRHDTYVDGKFALAIFRKAKVYARFIEFCPLDSHADVWQLADHILIRSVFPLIHYKDNFRELKKTEVDDHDLQKEVSVLLKLFDADPQLQAASIRYEELKAKNRINFQNLPGLFRVNQLAVYRDLRDEWTVARVSMVQEPSGDEWRFYGEKIDFDGKEFRFVNARQKISSFSGERNITDLPVYPLEYYFGKDNLIKGLINSGGWWKSVQEKLTDKRGNPLAHVMQYTGYCQLFQDTDDDDPVGKEIESRIIVDPKRYADRHMSYARHNQEPFRDDALLEVENEDNPLLLCPAKILVHSLNDNEWYYVATDPKRLLEAEWKPNAWSGLIKDRDVSPLMDRLRDLASAHQKRRDKARDLPTEPANEDGDNYDSRRIDNFKGKGKGLTFLLHGPPGVGKTMLAECLSEDQKRPLYRVNLGMLTGLTTWEAKIEEIFRQAHFWDAILLIDEAEVVLAERTQENMKQSAWVAVFLRKIEYFEGLVFLTTNQIHFIDLAFESRVTLGIQFPDLEPAIRKEIWVKILESLPKRAEAKWISEEDIDEWAKYLLNGRQIRNIIHSALLLAELQGSSGLKPKQIEECIKHTNQLMEIIKREKKKVEMEYLPSQWS